MSDTVKVASTVRMEGARPRVAEPDPDSLAPTLDGRLHAHAGAPTAAASRTTLRPTGLPNPGPGGAAPLHAGRPRYQTEGLLGEGGMGEVLRSVDNDIE